MNDRPQSDNPTFYVYETKDGWAKTDAKLTAQLNSPTFNDTSILAGRSFYPQWPEPEFKSQTRVAWRITPDGIKVVRNRLIDGEKRPKRVALMLRWDGDKKFWVLNEPQQDQQLIGGKRGA